MSTRNNKRNTKRISGDASDTTRSNEYTRILFSYAERIVREQFSLRKLILLLFSFERNIMCYKIRDTIVRVMFKQFFSRLYDASTVQVRGANITKFRNSHYLKLKFERKKKKKTVVSSIILLTRLIA